MAREKKPKLADICLVPEPLANASPKREWCEGCALFKECSTPFMEPWVPEGWFAGPRILAVGEGPGENEDEQGRPFVGKAGHFLRECVEGAGLEWDHFALVNAVRCRPPDNRTPRMSEIRACRPFLLRVIERLEPKVIIALGASALRALTNDRDVSISRNRGKLLVIPGSKTRAKVYVTYRPAAYLHAGKGHGPSGPQIRDYIISDLKRASWRQLPYPKNEMPKGDTISLDAEWSKDEKLLALSVADTRSAARVTPREAARVLKRTRLLVGHSMADDIDHLIRAKLPVRKEWIAGIGLRDSLLLAKMADENRGEKGAYKLEPLLLSHHNVKPWKAETQEILDETGDAANWSPEQLDERVRLDAWGAAVLVDTLKPKVLEEVPAKTAEFQHRIAMTLHRVRLTGAVIDMKKFHAMGQAWQASATKSRDLLVKHARRAGMKEFIPTNDGHIRTLLFKKLKLPVTRKTNTGLPAVDKITLKQFAGNKVVGVLTEFNKTDKLASTWYGNPDRKSKNPPLVKLIRPIGKIGGVEVGHIPVRLITLGARTWRRASAAPNWQNWPEMVRTIVRSRYKGGLIFANDYKRLEVVLMAWDAGEPKLLKYFLGGEGYIGVGRDLFGKEVEDGSADYKVIKSIVLGIQFGMKKWKLGNDLWYRAGVRFSKDWKRHVEKAGELRELYLATYPALPKYMRARTEELLETQRIVAPDGAVRHLPCPDGEDTPGFWHLKNEAINFRIQHMASMVTGSAMLDVERELCSAYGLSLEEYHKQLLVDPLKLDMTLLINEVHDELDYDVFPRHRKRDVELITETMRAVPTLRRLVPEFDLELKTDPVLGPAWAVKGDSK